MKIFPRPESASVPAVPVMAGFASPRLPHERKWKRRGLYALMAFICFVYAFFVILVPRPVMIPLLFPFLALIFFIVWALPVGERHPGKASERLFWCYTVTLLLWPNYLAIALPGLPWITAARLFAAPLVLLILIYASNSQPFKDIMRPRLASVKPLWIMVAIFAVIQLVSIVAAPEPFSTLNRVFNNQVAWTGMFFAAVWALRDPRSLQRWMIAYVIMTLILGVMAIWEARLGKVIWANSVPSIFQIEDPLVQKILSGSYRLTGQYRVQTTATTPLSFAELMALAVPFLLYLMHKHPRIWFIAGCLLVEGLILNSLIQADARLGFVGFILGHFLYLAFFSINLWRTRRDSLMGASLVVALPVLIAIGIGVVLLVGRVRVKVLGGGQHQWSNQARFDQMSMAFEKIWASPMFGFGSGQGAAQVGFVNGEGMVTIDSYYLSILMDYGIVGFFAFYGMFAYAIARSVKLAFGSGDFDIRGLSAALGIFLSEFVVIKLVLSQEANHPLAFIVLGAIATVAYASRPKENVTSR
ncbi:MAG: O-antigen ligase family protein [Afipia birgiae]|nr:O-antigen ligase family protein [Afipia birgiae]